MTTALVLSGGGSLGAVQVGMLLALADHGVVPDLVVGASVGAVNGAYIAGRPGREGAEALASIWTSVRRSDVFPVQPFLSLFALAGRADHLVPHDKFRRFLQRYLDYSDLEDASCPFCLVATDVGTGEEVVLSRGPVVDAVLASVAVPGVFSPVRIGGRDLMDGAVTNYTPISVAVEAGAETVYVLHTGYACALPTPPRSALGMALHALTLIVQQRLLADVTAYRAKVRLHVAPPLCPMEVSPADFSHNSQLITRGREETRTWLEEGMPDDDPIRNLRLHKHE
ncbi:MAG TPA: patatin-like phospholipase family protein [Streptosporangiaceae bacterium]|nr:patatin-like phospholipase family protein [Streptosporangiaceae bacterium]